MECRLRKLVYRMLQKINRNLDFRHFSKGVSYSDLQVEMQPTTAIHCWVLLRKFGRKLVAEFYVRPLETCGASPCL